MPSPLDCVVIKFVRMHVSCFACIVDPEKTVFSFKTTSLFHTVKSFLHKIQDINFAPIGVYPHTSNYK